MLLSWELPAKLADADLTRVLDLASAVLDSAQIRLLRRCLGSGETTRPRRVEIDGAVLTVCSSRESDR